jgi:hypothetical protein
MNQPILSAFADPSNNLVGFGPSGIVGTAGPFLAGSAFRILSENGIYPSPSSLLQFPLGYAQLKFDNPYAEQASLEIENEIAKDLYVSVGYQFVHGLKLPTYSSINGVPSGALPSGLQSFAPADFNFGFTLLGAPSAYSIYHAGIISLRTSFAYHYSVLANYTFSKSIDLSTDVQLTGVPMDYLYPRFRPCIWQQRHPPSLCFYNAGRIAPANWPLLFRNSKVSMLNALQSPRHFTILAGFDVNGDGFPFSDRVANIARNTYRGDTSYTTDVRDNACSTLPSVLRARPASKCLTYLTGRMLKTSTPLTAPLVSPGLYLKRLGMELQARLTQRLARQSSLHRPANPARIAAEFLSGWVGLTPFRVRTARRRYLRACPLLCGCRFRGGFRTDKWLRRACRASFSNELPPSWSSFAHIGKVGRNRKTFLYVRNEEAGGSNPSRPLLTISLRTFNPLQHDVIVTKRTHVRHVPAQDDAR